MSTGLKVNSALHTEHVTLYDFFHSAISIAVEQFRPHSGLLQDMGCHPAMSLSFNINELK